MLDGIDVTLTSLLNVTDLSELQLLKVYVDQLDKLFGITISFNDVHEVNTLVPKIETFVGITTLSNFEQYEKA